MSLIVFLFISFFFLSLLQRLAADESGDEEWPTELLSLRDRFRERYEIEIVEMEAKHREEVARLKDEHLKMLNGALERARRRSLREDSLTDVEIIKDRYVLKVFSSFKSELGKIGKWKYRSFQFL